MENTQESFVLNTKQMRELLWTVIVAASGTWLTVSALSVYALYGYGHSKVFAFLFILVLGMLTNIVQLSLIVVLILKYIFENTKVEDVDEH